MPGRKYTSENKYRFGFNGMEKDDDVNGEGNSYTTSFRPYDPRLGRWYKVDPKTHLMPWETPYSFANNMPIYGNDPEGDICVPCVIIIIGFLTAPAVAVAPSGQPKDAIAIQNAYDLQSQWILNSAVAGNGTILKELGKQFLLATIIGGSKDLYTDAENFDVFKTIQESYNSLDYFDAALGGFDISKTMKIILSSTIDISPEEGQFLFADKTVHEASIDAVFNALSELTGNKLTKTKWHKYFKSVVSKTDEVIQGEMNKELKEFLGESGYQDFQNNVNDILNGVKVTPLEIDNNNMYKIDEPVGAPVPEATPQEEVKQGTF